jgi:hypothetical protein
MVHVYNPVQGDGTTSSKSVSQSLYTRDSEGEQATQSGRGQELPLLLISATKTRPAGIN